MDQSPLEILRIGTSSSPDGLQKSCGVDANDPPLPLNQVFPYDSLQRRPSRSSVSR
jgi:hypothetical protein